MSQTTVVRAISIEASQQRRLAHAAVAASQASQYPTLDTRQQSRGKGVIHPVLRDDGRDLALMNVRTAHRRELLAFRAFIRLVEVAIRPQCSLGFNRLPVRVSMSGSFGWRGRVIWGNPRSFLQGRDASRHGCEVSG